MKAAVIERQGGLENLVYRDWPDPTPRPGDALVRVRAVGLNHLDVFVRRGMPGFPVPMPFISGGDIAGEVAALGDRVTGFKIGDRIAVNPVTPDGMMGEEIPGGMAEFVRVPAENLIRIPDHLPFDVAACVPIAYGTAMRMLVTIGQLQANELVLVLGASGGVGTAAVQIAKMLGASVIAAVGSQDKAERLKAIGADHVINYKDEDFSRAAWTISNKQGVDVVVNFTGGETWIPSLRTLRRRGRLLTCGATAGHNPQTDLRYIWVRELQVLGSNSYTHGDIAQSLELVANGTLRPIISHRFPLSQAAEAERLLEERGVLGKIVLEP